MAFFLRTQYPYCAPRKRKKERKERDTIIMEKVSPCGKCHERGKNSCGNAVH